MISTASSAATHPTPHFFCKLLRRNSSLLDQNQCEETTINSKAGRKVLATAANKMIDQLKFRSCIYHYKNQHLDNILQQIKPKTMNYNLLRMSFSNFRLPGKNTLS